MCSDWRQNRPSALLSARRCKAYSDLVREKPAAAGKSGHAVGVDVDEVYHFVWHCLDGYTSAEPDGELKALHLSIGQIESLESGLDTFTSRDGIDEPLRSANRPEPATVRSEEHTSELQSH